MDTKRLPIIQESDGPFTDEMLRDYQKIAQTQHAIIKYAEAMAQVLAEAGRASNKAVGDPPGKAVDKWLGVIRSRAMELLREDKQKKLEPPTIDN